MEKEKTLVFIKPDGVERKLIGEIIKRFEQSGLDIIKLKMIIPSPELVEKHYPSIDTNKEWFLKIGKKTKENYKKLGLDYKDVFGTDDDLEIGKIVKSWLIDYIAGKRIVLMVLEGYHAVEKVRKICGDTIPLNANPGTIRGDFGIDSAHSANVEKRAIYNIIHASDSVEEAKREIALWFGNE